MRFVVLLQIGRGSTLCLLRLRELLDGIYVQPVWLVLDFKNQGRMF
jgi:hypothetical protein